MLLLSYSSSDAHAGLTTYNLNVGLCVQVSHRGNRVCLTPGGKLQLLCSSRTGRLVQIKNWDDSCGNFERVRAQDPVSLHRFDLRRYLTRPLFVTSLHFGFSSLSYTSAFRRSITHFLPLFVAPLHLRFSSLSYTSVFPHSHTHFRFLSLPDTFAFPHSLTLWLFVTPLQLSAFRRSHTLLRPS